MGETDDGGELMDSVFLWELIEAGEKKPELVGALVCNTKMGNLPNVAFGKYGCEKMPQVLRGI